MTKGEKDIIIAFFTIISGISAIIFLYDRFIASSELIDLSPIVQINKDIIIFITVIITFLFVGYLSRKYIKNYYAIKNLEIQLNQIDIILKNINDSSLFQEWKNTTESLIKKYMGDDSTSYNSFKSNRYIIMATDKTTKADLNEQKRNGLRRARGIIKGAIRELKIKG